MDAVQFYKQFARYCTTSYCGACNIVDYCKTKAKDGRDAEKIVREIEQWAKEHPVKTRQSEFLKMFPKADLKIITHLLPCTIDSDMKPLRCAKYGYLSITCRCDRCRDDYWNEEVSE